jgi:hypothetical protein
MPEIKVVYDMSDKYKTLIYVDVDAEGNIIASYMGKNVIPDREYHHFFYVENYIGESILNYKVIIVDNLPVLQAIDTDLEKRLKDEYYRNDKEYLQQQYELKMAELQALQEQLNTL